MSMGVSVITMGNWTWGNRELFEFIDESKIDKCALDLECVEVCPTGAIEIIPNDR